VVFLAKEYLAVYRSIKIEGVWLRM